MIIVPYEALLLDEALFLLTQHEEGYFDADRKALVIEEDSERIK